MIVSRGEAERTSKFFANDDILYRALRLLAIQEDRSLYARLNTYSF
jgi:hypothetical protein